MGDSGLQQRRKTGFSSSSWSLSPFFASMDGFRVVKLSEVIRQVDVVITCTGRDGEGRGGAFGQDEKEQL